MSITIEPNKGLRLKLGHFTPIRTWHGGSSFWSHEFQLTVRQGALAAFLPRALEDDDSVLFEHRVGGVELASTSAPITNISQVPERELQNLRDAVDELKSKAEDPRCDRTKRQMIESFRLPDPQTDRDLYRLVGKGSQQKLIVLWGVEREEGTALAPSAAVDLMHTPAAEESLPAARKKSAFVPILVCLAVLGAGAAGGYYYWQQDQKKQQAAAQAAFNARAAANAAARASAPADHPGSAPSASPAPRPSTSSGAAPASPLAIPSSMPDPAKSNSSVAHATPADSKMSGNPFGTKPDAARTSLTSAGTKSTPSPGATPGKSPAPKSSEPDKAKPIASGTPIGGVSKIGKTTLAGTPLPSSPVASKNSSTTNLVTGTPGAVTGNGRVMNGLPVTVAKNGTTVVTGTPGAVIGNGRVVNGLPVTVAKNGPDIVHAVPGAVMKDGTVVHGAPGTVTDVPAASVSTPMTTKGPPPAGISSLNVVSTSLSPLLSDGKVEVLLNVVARNTGGTVINAPPISEWRVDGVVWKKADGTLADGPVLPLALPAGKHSITTLGRGADGNPFQTDADVIVSPKE